MDSSATVTTGDVVGAKGRVREFLRGDVDKVAGLFLHAFLGKQEPAPKGLCEYFERTFFDHPWSDLNVAASCLFEDETGEVGGFFGAHPRVFVCAGRTVTAVAHGQLMVSPMMRKMGVAEKLIAAVRDGPQALSFVTTTSVASRRIFLRLGYWSPPFAGLKWHKVLGGSSRVAGRLRRLLRGKARLSQEGAAELVCRRLTEPAELCNLRETFADQVKMRAVPSLAQAEWIWNLIRDSQRDRQLCACVVRDRADRAVGWAVYLVTPACNVKILELSASAAESEAVVARLLDYLRREGFSSVEGHCVTPELTAALAAQGATLRSGFSGAVFHCKDEEARFALLNGDVFLSELDGESWLNFNDR